MIWPWKAGREGSHFQAASGGSQSLITLIPFDLERPIRQDNTFGGEAYYFVFLFAEKLSDCWCEFLQVRCILSCNQQCRNTEGRISLMLIVRNIVSPLLFYDIHVACRSSGVHKQYRCVTFVRCDVCHVTWLSLLAVRYRLKLFIRWLYCARQGHIAF